MVHVVISFGKTHMGGPWWWLDSSTKTTNGSCKNMALSATKMIDDDHNNVICFQKWSENITQDVGNWEGNEIREGVVRCLISIHN